jgi:hypothetical protein
MKKKNLSAQAHGGITQLTPDTGHHPKDGHLTPLSPITTPTPDPPTRRVYKGPGET